MTDPMTQDAIDDLERRVSLLEQQLQTVIDMTSARYDVADATTRLVKTAHNALAADVQRKHAEVQTLLKDTLAALEAQDDNDDH